LNPPYLAAAPQRGSLTPLTAAALIALAVAACGGPSQQQRATAWAADPIEWARRAPANGWVVLDPSLSEPMLDDAALKERLRGARVVFVGEQHDQAQHHRFQAHVLSLVAEVAAEERADEDRAGDAGGEVLLGLEMLRWPDQPLLDAFDRGEATEDSLRALWNDSWGKDWGLYAPLLALASRPDIDLLALNAPRFLSRRVFEAGVEGLTDDERRYMPPLLDDSNPHYRAFVTEAMHAHGPAHGSAHGGPGHGAPSDAPNPALEAATQRFFLAQLIWDETMADTLTRALHAAPLARAVVAAGAAHIMYGWGVPSRVARDSPDTAQLLILCRTVPDDPESLRALLDPAAADLFCLTRAPHPDARSASASPPLYGAGN
jgi:uncharacterized iron-regulated protein